MIRFILHRSTYTAQNDDRGDHWETIDCDVPQLEAILKRGGVGGGPDNDNFDHTVVVAAELRKPETGSEDKRGE